MKALSQTSAAVRSITKVEQSPDRLELEKVINVTFMTMLETPDLSCVYRVSAGETARSIVQLALKKSLDREPVTAEIESHLCEVAKLNQDNIENLKPGEIFLLPMEHHHALGHKRRTTHPTADVSRRVLQSANCPRPANVELVIAPPGLDAAPGRCIKGDDSIIATRNASQPEDNEINATVSYHYQGELSSSFLGLLRSFFVASETRNSVGELLTSKIEYDGFGTSIKFMTIAGVIELLVRTIETKYEYSSDLYETVVVCADGMKHTLASSRDGNRTWRI